ncbi:MAG: hypothetical protein NW703_05100 [Nitrospiraceae bacterium]
MIRRWLRKRLRFRLRLLPTSASWRNLVERRFVLLTERQLRRGVSPSARLLSVRPLKAAIRVSLAHTNAHLNPCVWTKTADEILVSVARSCRRTSETGL